MARKSQTKAKAKVAPPKTLVVPHVRANDYREFFADGASVRVDNAFVTLGVFINDTYITSETMELMGDPNGVFAQYRPASAEEARVRTNVCSIRIPISAFQDAITLFGTKLEQLSQTQIVESE